MQYRETMYGRSVRNRRCAGVGDRRPTDRDLDNEASYLRNPLAFWLRPDGDFLSDAPYVPKRYWYDPVADVTWSFEYAS